LGQSAGPGRLAPVFLNNSWKGGFALVEAFFFPTFFFSAFDAARPHLRLPMPTHSPFFVALHPINVLATLIFFR